MTFPSGALFVSLACFAASSGCVFKDPEIEGPGPGWSLSGRVSGAVRSGVTVRLSGADSAAARETTTDEAGDFRFSDVPQGTYTIVPNSPKYSFHPATLSATVGPDSSGLDFVSVGSLQVYGRDMGSYYQNVSVLAGGTPVNDAQVSVNGAMLTHPTPWYEDGYYHGTLRAEAPGGTTLVLEVKRGDATVKATGVVPEYPLLTSPTQGASFGPSEDILVAWSCSTRPDRFVVTAQWSCGSQCGTGRRYAAPGSARSLTIPARDLPAGQIMLSVFSYSDGVITGDYAPYESYSGMNIRGEWMGVTISR